MHDLYDLYDLYPSSNLFGCESGLTLDDFGGLAIEGCHGHHPELCRVNGQRHLVRLVWPGTGARWLGGSVARGVVTRAQLARSRSCHLLPVISGKTFYTKRCKDEHNMTFEQLSASRFPIPAGAKGFQPR